MFETGQALQTGLVDLLDPQIVASAVAGASLPVLGELLLQRYSRSQEGKATRQKLRVALKGEINAQRKEDLEGLHGKFVPHDVFPTQIYEQSIGELGMLTEDEVAKITAYYSAVYMYEDALRLWQDSRRDGGIELTGEEVEILTENMSHYLKEVSEFQTDANSAFDEHEPGTVATDERRAWPTQFAALPVKPGATRGVSPTRSRKEPSSSEAVPPADLRPQDRWRPAPAGVSVGHYTGTAGTLGAPALETDDGVTVFLTTALVAAPQGVAKRGDTILQPGPTDGGAAPDDKIGELYEWSYPSAESSTKTDSALVEVEDGAVQSEILGIGELAGWSDATVGETYYKSGRTSGVTTLTLDQTDVEVTISGYRGEPVTFEGLHSFSGGILPGDAGSLVVRKGGEEVYGVSLLFAGSSATALGIPIDTIQDEHGTLRPTPLE